MWHCPHCGAPQAETARCWVCRRSSTTCSTCRHFRPALSADLGYCALDRARRPLTGRELRGCWEERPESTAPEAAPPVEPHRRRAATSSGAARARGSWDHAPGREFVPLDILGRLPAPVDAPGSPPAPDPASEAPAAFLLEIDEDWTDRTSLFGEREP
jgi:hypothetical protein